MTTPYDLLPPKEIAKRWTDLLPHLDSGRVPVCLAMGEEDAVRAKLWRESPDVRYFRDEASGLGLAAMPGALWVDVPSRFTSPPPAEATHPAVAGGTGGLWEELIAFLPALPGDLTGVLILSNPEQPSDEAGAAALWLAGKLDSLFAHSKTGAVPIWLAASRLEGCPGGRRLLKNLAEGDAYSRSLLGQPLGTKGNAASLSADIERFLLGCDTGMRDSRLARSAYLVKRNLSRHLANAELFSSRLSAGRRTRKAMRGGLFLCGANPITEGLAFTGELTRSIIPGFSVPGKQRFRRWLSLALWAVVAAASLAAYLSYREAKREIAAIPFDLLDAAPDAGRFGGLPPISRYALARDKLNAIRSGHSFTKWLYPAVGKKLSLADEMFVENLRSWLPGENDRAALERWLESMIAWAGGRPGVKPHAFSAPSGAILTTIPAAFTAAGRKQAATLLADWRSLLPAEDAPRVDALLKAYDERVFAAWRQSGATLTKALENASRAIDFEEKKDSLDGAIIFSFLHIAARELGFASRAESEWRDTVLAVHEADAAAALSEGEIRNSIQSGGRMMPRERLDAVFHAAECWRAYRSGLDAIQESRKNEAGLAALAAAAFSPPPPEKTPSPSLAAILEDWTRFRAALTRLEPRSGSGPGREALLLTVLPFRMAFAAALTAAASGVQTEWDETVRIPLTGMKGEAAVLTLVEEKLLDAFLSGSAAAYLKAAGEELRPASALGATIPFSPAFPSWLNTVRPAIRRLSMEYPVRLVLRPVTVNPSARVFPRGVSFTMDSTLDAPSGQVRVTGYNHPVAASFAWSLPTAGDVTVTIHFDAFELPVRFSGGMGLVKLLHFLKDGAMRFTPADFPTHRRKLEDRGVRSIVVNIDIDAGGAEHLSPVIDAVPETIVDLPLAEMP